MKREFLNQDDLANKFWHIEQAGSQLQVHYGRVGTAGQQQTKQFASPEAAAKEAEKLVREKLRKGYVEQAPGAAVPDKQPTNPLGQELEHYLRLGLHTTADFLETINTDIFDGNLETESFSALDFIETKFGDDDARFEHWLRQQLAEQLKRQRAREASYPARTDFDRLAAAFADLNRQHVVAIHGATDTRSGGEEMAWSAQEADSQGFCFYHTQHLRGFDAPQRLYLYFGSYDDNDAAVQAIGRRVVAALQAQGLPVNWNDSPDTGIELPVLHWQKRFDNQDWPHVHLASRAAAGSPTIAEAVAALKKYAEALSQRPDVLVDGPYLGGPAPTDLIRHLRDNPRLLPKELVDLYELMDGFELSWAFRTQPADEDEEMEDPDGRLLLPPLSDEVRLRTDRENGYTFFGPGTVSVFFDQTQPEFGTWLVAYPPTGRLPDDELADYEPYEATAAEEAAAHATADVARARLLLAYPGDGDLGTPLPYTLAEYLLQAVAHGLVVEWPRALDGEGYPELTERIARILAPPAA